MYIGGIDMWYSIKRKVNKVLCKLFGRHYFVVGTDIRDGHVYLECPYCGEVLFDYTERPDKE